VSDDLGLGLEEESPEPSSGPPNYGARRLGVAIGIVAFAAVVVIVVGLFTRGIDGLRNFFGDPADYSGAGTGSVVVQIHQGDSLSTIGHELAAAHVVRSGGAFTKAAGDNDRARLIGPGFYKLRLHMKAALAVTLLLDPKSLVASKIVVTEGMRMDAILLRIAANTQISLASLKAAAASPSSLGVPSWAAGHSLEGFLFPATYTFSPGTTAHQALAAMVTKFNEVASSIGLVEAAAARHQTPYQVLTLASIVQREARLDSDFAKIAEVFDNRLARGMSLGSDATLFYVLPLNHGPLTASDLRIDSPYNTRIHTGLPPTPINSPGELALQSVLKPAVGPYLYFVTIDKQGHAAFATTLAEFNQLVAQSRRNGVR
jgi:UPF0755 protein